MHVCVNQSIWCPTVFPLHPLSYDLFHSCESKCHLQAEYFQMHVYSSDAFSEFHPDIPHSFLEISFLCLKISRWKNWKLYFWLLSTPIHTQSQVLKCISLAFFFSFSLNGSLVHPLPVLTLEFAKTRNTATCNSVLYFIPYIQYSFSPGSQFYLLE